MGSARAAKQNNLQGSVVFYGGWRSSVSSCCILLTLWHVERTFFGVRCMCPFMVAIDVGRCIRTASTVSPGNTKI